jgi:hypothetical protein
MRDRIIILTAAAMLAAGLIMTNPRPRVTNNAWEATPVLAQQFSTGSYRQPAYSYPGGQGGWFSSVIGGLFGASAGRAVAWLF